MMAAKLKSSLIQQAITSATSLSRTKQLPFKELETATLTQTASPLSEDIETTKETLFPPNELYIGLKLSPEVAILHIYQNGMDEYALWGGNAVTDLQQTKSNKPPNLSLGKLVQNGEPPINIKSDMSVFSRSNIELRKWLKTLRHRFGEQLYLVIADHTDFEIPWEMVELSPRESPNEYLGALITTVRWRQVIRGDDYVVLEIKRDECYGNAIAYVLEELDEVGAEIDILEQLQAVIYRSSKHHIKAFQDHLQQNDFGYSFVYISCHGTFEGNIREIALGSNRDRQQQLQLQSLYDCQFNLLKNSQGIVFMNACHSGRYQAHPAIPHTSLSFVDLFLEKGARGVIGTLGAVGDSHAAKFARDFIQESLGTPKLSVAALLRKLRLKVVENLPDEPTTTDLLPFIYTFMYVYYGNPMTVLRLTSPGEQPNV